MTRPVTSSQAPVATHAPEWWGSYRARLEAHGHNLPRHWQDVPVTRTLPAFPAFDRLKDAALVYQSSGTTGAPKTIVYSSVEWKHAVHARAWCLRRLGIGAGDRVALALPFGPWFSGDNISQALVQLGAVVLPCGLYEPHLRGLGNLIRSLAFDTLITTPSIARALLVRKNVSAIKRLITVGEALPSGLRRELEAGFGCRIDALFACSEGVIGHQLPDAEQTYAWNPDFVHLEVMQDDGVIASAGKGELLLTMRHRHLQPVLRLALGDIVTLHEDRFVFHGRKGHAFTLATGVKVARADLDAFLDKLPFAVSGAEFRLEHGQDGRDHLSVRLHTPVPEASAERARTILLENNMDIRDAVVSGLVRIDVECLPAISQVVRKRRIICTEEPWRL